MFHSIFRCRLGSSLLGQALRFCSLTSLMFSHFVFVCFSGESRQTREELNEYSLSVLSTQHLYAPELSGDDDNDDDDYFTMNLRS